MRSFWCLRSWWFLWHGLYLRKSGDDLLKFMAKKTRFSNTIKPRAMCFIVTSVQRAVFTCTLPILRSIRITHSNRDSNIIPIWFYGPCLFKYFNSVYLNKLTVVFIAYYVLSACLKYIIQLFMYAVLLYQYIIILKMYTPIKIYVWKRVGIQICF